MVFKKITGREDENEAILIPCELKIPVQYESFIRSHQLVSDTTRIGIFNKKGWLKDMFFTTLTLRNMIDNKNFDLIINPKLPKGKYYLRFSVQSGYYNSTHNSDKIELIIE